MLTVEKSIKFCNQVEFWDSNSLKKKVTYGLWQVHRCIDWVAW